jgi:tRNA(fMet)-specific endonuclease VapC
MTQYMLDTNTVSHLIKENPLVVQRLLAVTMASLCISAITEGELLFGLAKRPHAKRLHLAVREFLRRVSVLPWDSVAAEIYANVRAEMTLQGKSSGPLDMLIASHALSVNAVLVTNDQAIRQTPNLLIEDWMDSLPKKPNT